MEEAWRWFGPKDPIALAHIREAGATGIVTALHQIPGGTAWDDAAIAERKGLIEAEGLAWSVVESIPVTNAIKAQTADVAARRRRLEGDACAPSAGPASRPSATISCRSSTGRAPISPGGSPRAWRSASTSSTSPPTTSSS